MNNALLFKSNVEYLIFSKKTSISQVSKNAGVNKSTFTKAFQDKRLPSKNVINKLADALGVNPIDLISKDLNYANKITELHVHNSDGIIVGSIKSEISCNQDSYAFLTSENVNLSPLIHKKMCLIATKINANNIKDENILLIKTINNVYEINFVKRHNSKIIFLNGYLNVTNEIDQNDIANKYKDIYRIDEIRKGDIIDYKN